MNIFPQLFTGNDHGACLVEDTGAVLPGHFDLGGLHSQYYIDKLALLCRPKTTEMLCKLLADYLRKKNEIEVVVAPPPFGLHIAIPLALVMGVKVVQIDGDRKGYSIRPSAQELIANHKVLVVDCISISGIKLGLVSSLVRRLDGEVVEQAVLIDRGTSHPSYTGESRFTSLLRANLPITRQADCPVCLSGKTDFGPIPTLEHLTVRALCAPASS